MTNLNLSERKVLLLLLHSSSLKLGAFTIFKKLKIEMPSFIKALSDLEKHGFIKYSATEVELLEVGRNYIAKESIYLGPSEKKWEKIPQKYIIKELNANELYIPSKKLLSKKTFKNLQK